MWPRFFYVMLTAHQLVGGGVYRSRDLGSGHVKRDESEKMARKPEANRDLYLGRFNV